MRTFGRLPARDDRDAGFPVVRTLSQTRLIKYWNDLGWFGDQASTPQCVAYAWVHWLEDGPIGHPGPRPLVDPHAVYGEAQQVDEWPGENYDGTSVRAGAKALKARGLISEYRWATTIEDVVDCLLNRGPMVVGTNWYEGMMDPDRDRLRIYGPALGGHAYVLNGVNLKKGTFRVKNSWGRSWAGDGRALINIEDFETLLYEDGEACIATEVVKPPTPPASVSQTAP